MDGGSQTTRADKHGVRDGRGRLHQPLLIRRAAVGRSAAAVLRPAAELRRISGYLARGAFCIILEWNLLESRRRRQECPLRPPS